MIRTDKIPNTKNQIPNNIQTPIFNDQNKLKSH